MQSTDEQEQKLGIGDFAASATDESYYKPGRDDRFWTLPTEWLRGKRSTLLPSIDRRAAAPGPYLPTSGLYPALTNSLSSMPKSLAG